MRQQPRGAVHGRLAAIVSLGQKNIIIIISQYHQPISFTIIITEQPSILAAVLARPQRPAWPTAPLASMPPRGAKRAAAEAEAEPGVQECAEGSAGGAGRARGRARGRGTGGTGAMDRGELAKMHGYLKHHAYVKGDEQARKALDVYSQLTPPEKRDFLSHFKKSRKDLSWTNAISTVHKASNDSRNEKIKGWFTMNEILKLNAFEPSMMENH